MVFAKHTNLPSKKVNLSSFLNWVLFRVPFIRVPYYIGDLNRDTNLENYTFEDKTSGVWVYGARGSRV